MKKTLLLSAMFAITGIANAQWIEQDSFLVFCAFFNSILLIIWLIYYVRNNSFSSFYTKKPNSLFSTS